MLDFLRLFGTRKWVRLLTLRQQPEAFAHQLVGRLVASAADLLFDQALGFRTQGNLQNYRRR